MSNQSYQERDINSYLQTFRRFPVTFEKGQGSYLWDVEGNRYVDALAGIAVNSVGHAHPKVTKAIQEQAERLVHISNFFLSDPQVRLAEQLKTLSGLDRVFFTNSGAESVEGAIKVARKYAHSIGRGGTILSFSGSFHGRTLGTIATGKKAMQEGFEPIPLGFKQVPFNDLDAVKAQSDQTTAAILIEPIQGEGGIRLADPKFLKQLRSFCDRESIVLIFDEIQSGIGRTGHWFGKDHFNVQPDVMTLAKALGGGVPIGAILSNEKIGSAMHFGGHGTTFGGNPLVCAAALAVLEVIEEENLLQAAKEKGDWIRNQLSQAKLPGIKEIRGVGLMIGVEFDFETAPLVKHMLEHGVIANATAGNVLRLVPPLNIDQAALDLLIKTIASSVKELNNG